MSHLSWSNGCLRLLHRPPFVLRPSHLIPRPESGTPGGRHDGMVGPDARREQVTVGKDEVDHPDPRTINMGFPEGS